jgi:hypothetical protein
MSYQNKLLILLFLFPLFSIAQKNYKPGYVITLKGDTLHGFIDYREWNNNPTTIKFKSLPDNNIRKLSAKDINYFSVNDMAEYQRYAGPLSMDPINFASMIEERDTSFKVDTVFLELIQRGKNVALYSYADNLKVRFFIGERPDYTPVELGYKLYYDMTAVTYTHGRTVNENTYEKQLFALAEKYNTVSDALVKYITESNYKEYHLLHIVTVINEITKQKSHKKHG